MKIKIEVEFDTDNIKDSELVEKITQAIDTLNATYPNQPIKPKQPLTPQPNKRL